MNEEQFSNTLNRPRIKPEVARGVLANDERDLLQAGSRLLGVERTDNGKYRVRFPSLKSMQTGNYLGISYLEADDYLEAQKLFLKLGESMENLEDEPLLELKIGNTEISFSNFDGFHPLTAFEKTPIEPHSIISELLKNDKPSGTWKHTIEQENWQGRIFSFVKSFVASSEHMRKVIEADQIKDLSNLSPRQAIDITTHLVVLLTKYHQGYIQGHETEADNSTVMQLLAEGIKNRDNPDWQGNGVCRNFADTTKAVFESIKANQNRYSQLNNTYCVIRTGNADSYNPSFYGQGRFRGSDDNDRHAWNDFIQVSSEGGKANVASIDITWARYDLDQQTVLGLDKTLKRLQMPVKMISEQLSDDEQSNAEIQKIISYYDLMIRNPKETPSGRVFYARQIMGMLMNRDIRAITNDKTSPLDSVAYVYLSGEAEEISQQELTSLSTFFPNNKNYTKMIVNAYFDKNEDYLLFFPFGGMLVFKDNDILQEAINAKLKKLEKYEQMLQVNRAFRMRVKNMRTQIAAPELSEDP
jgi:hypothetical protein